MKTSAYVGELAVLLLLCVPASAQTKTPPDHQTWAFVEKTPTSFDEAHALYEDERYDLYDALKKLSRCTLDDKERNEVLNRAEKAISRLQTWTAAVTAELIERPIVEGFHKLAPSLPARRPTAVADLKSLDAWSNFMIGRIRYLAGLVKKGSDCKNPTETTAAKPAAEKAGCDETSKQAQLYARIGELSKRIVELEQQITPLRSDLDDAKIDIEQGNDTLRQIKYYKQVPEDKPADFNMVQEEADAKAKIADGETKKAQIEPRLKPLQEELDKANQEQKDVVAELNKLYKSGQSKPTAGSEGDTPGGAPRAAADQKDQKEEAPKAPPAKPSDQDSMRNMEKEIDEALGSLMEQVNYGGCPTAPPSDGVREAAVSPAIASPTATIAVDRVKQCTFGTARSVATVLTPTDASGKPLASATQAKETVTAEITPSVAERRSTDNPASNTPPTNTAQQPSTTEQTPPPGPTPPAVTDTPSSIVSDQPPSAPPARTPPPDNPPASTPEQPRMTEQSPPPIENPVPPTSQSPPSETVTIDFNEKVNLEEVARNLTSARVELSALVKLQAITPALPGSGEKSSQDKGFDKDPASGRIGSDGHRRVTVDEPQAYGLPNGRGAPTHFRVEIDTPQHSGLVAETASKTIKPTELASMLPAGVKAAIDTVRFGGHSYTRVGLDWPRNQEFDPATAAATIGRAIGAKLATDTCRRTKPAPAGALGPVSLSAVSNAMPATSIKLWTHH